MFSGQELVVSHVPDENMQEKLTGKDARDLTPQKSSSFRD